jgi:hypothetical protein
VVVTVTEVLVVEVVVMTVLVVTEMITDVLSEVEVVWNVDALVVVVVAVGAVDTRVTVLEAILRQLQAELMRLAGTGSCTEKFGNELTVRLCLYGGLKPVVVVDVEVVVVTSVDVAKSILRRQL